MLELALYNIEYFIQFFIMGLTAEAKCINIFRKLHAFSDSYVSLAIGTNALRVVLSFV